MVLRGRRSRRSASRRHGDLRKRLDIAPGADPLLHPSAQISSDAIETDTAEVDDRFVQLIVGLQDEDDVLVERGQPAHPGHKI